MQKSPKISFWKRFVEIFTWWSKVWVNNPLPTDGDSVYAKDIDLDNSDTWAFTGDLLELFNNYDTEIIDISWNNPKTYTLRFKRPLNSNKIGIWSQTWNFSNVKIQLKDLAWTVRTVIDDSANNTKLTSNVYAFTTNVFIEAIIEFHTTDAVKISGMFIPKSQSRNISSIDGYISETNSSETPLIASAVLIWGQVDTLNYWMILVSVNSDVDSAIDWLSIQFRSTPTWPWLESDSYTITGGSLKTFSIQTVFRFMRIVYTNWLTGQTSFHLQTTLKPVYVKPSSHRVADTINGQDDAELSKANLIWEDQNWIYQNIRSTEVGNLMTADFLIEVARGNIPWYSSIRKFWFNPIIISNTPADIYEWGQTIWAKRYTFSANNVADIDRLSSDDVWDTNISITIEWLDIDWIEVIQTISTDWTDWRTPIALTTPLWRINRVFNSNGTDLLGNVYVFVNWAVTLWVPNDVTSVRWYISIWSWQTLQWIYTVPAWKTWYFYWVKTSIIKKQAAFATFTAQVREFGKVARVQDTFGLTTTGSSRSNDVFEIPIRYPEKTDFIPLADVDSTIGFSISYFVLLIDN